MLAELRTKQNKLFDAAAEAFRKAIELQPAFWWAWEALAELLSGTPMTTEQTTVELERLPNHWMKRLFFEPCLLLRCHREGEAMQLYCDLNKALGGNCHYVSLQFAACLVELRDFPPAQQIYEKLRDVHPSSLAGMDLYSNILFLQEDVHELTYLAHEALKINRTHPVTSYIIGNYFSLTDDHGKAVQHFQRALALDPRFLAAWNLLGLEYVELRNTSAAIHAFRSAVDIDPREYRAWYGLGQSYELRKAPYFSIFYYEKAAALRPTDPRMFFALAAQYEALGESFLAKAIELYEKATELGDPEGIAIAKLARLNEQLGHVERAAHFHQLVVDHCDRMEERITPRLSEALWFLAQYHYQSTRQLHLTKRYCLRLQDFQCREGESAKSLLVQVHNEARFQKQLGETTIHQDKQASQLNSSLVQPKPPQRSNLSFLTFDDSLLSSPLHRSLRI